MQITLERELDLVSNVEQVYRTMRAVTPSDLELDSFVCCLVIRHFAGSQYTVDKFRECKEGFELMVELTRDSATGFEQEIRGSTSDGW